MYNPPIIKPRKYASGGIVSEGLEGNQEFFRQKREEAQRKKMQNLILGQARGRGLNNPFIPEDPILSPDDIQKDLDALTSDLKNVKSEKPKKEQLVNEKETKELDDVDDFKSWIKENTATDATTGELFFIQPISGEKVPLEGNPETNVLLYEVFKEQTGRKGEALEAIKTMDIEEFQATPSTTNIKELNTNKDFISDLGKVQKNTDNNNGGLGLGGGLGMAAGAALGSRLGGFGAAAGAAGGYALGKMLGRGGPTLDEEAVRLEANSRGLMAGGSPGSFAQEIDQKRGAKMSAYADDLKRQQALALQEKRQNEDRQFYAYRKPGETEYRLTPSPLNEQEVYDLSREGKYEITSKELATEVRGAPEDKEQEFLRKAILAGRIPMSGGQEEEISTPMQDINETVLESENVDVLDNKISENFNFDIPENYKFKRFTNATLPGLYTRGTKDPLKYQLEVYTAKDGSGDVIYKPGPDLDTIMQDIYKASEYSTRSKEEINAVKQLVNASSVGVTSTLRDFIETVGLSITGAGQNIPPSDFQKLRKWAQNFTAKNITTILGESNRTISDADRTRAQEIVDAGEKWTSIPKVKLALEELIGIFEMPGRNAEAAYQALMNQAETSGYLDEMLDIEKRLYNKRIKGGSGKYAPTSSRIFLDAEKGETENVFKDEYDIELDLTS